MWLAEWRAHVVLSAVTADALPGRSDSGAGKRHVAARAAGGASAAPGVGQIRLLRPGPATESGARTGWARPVYVAVLAERGAGLWLVAPFSRFVSPAVPGEWLTGLRPIPLKALCLWNAREFDAAAAGSSWVSGTLPQAKVADALDVWRSVNGAGPMRRVSEGRVGPPLLHPLDPRHAYLQEESELLDLLVGCLPTGLTSGRRSMYDLPQSGYCKAAEEHGSYGEGKK